MKGLVLLADIAKVGLEVGSILPVVGRVCERVQKGLERAENQLNNIKDVETVAERFNDVAKFLIELPRVLKYLKDKSELEELMEEIEELLKEFEETANKFNESGYLKRFLKSIICGDEEKKKLNKIDSKMKSKLKELKELYNLIRDEEMMKKLNEILERQAEFPFEKEMNEMIQRKFENILNNQKSEI